MPEFTVFLMEIISKFLNKFILAAIILLIGFIIGRVLGKVVQKLLHEIELNKTFKAITNINLSLEGIIGSFISYFVYFISVVMALEQFGLNVILFNIIAGIVLLVIALSVLLAIKDFVPNAFAGIILYRKKFLNKDDIIETKGVRGRITAITLTEIKLHTKSGDTIIIPTSVIMKEGVKKLKNY